MADNTEFVSVNGTTETTTYVQQGDVSYASISTATQEHVERVRTQVTTQEQDHTSVEKKRIELRELSQYNSYAERNIGPGRVIGVNPVTFQRKVDPNRYSQPFIPEAGPPQIVDKQVERIVEFIQPQEVDKVVERVVEKLEVVDMEVNKEVPTPTIQWQVQEIVKEVPFEREVIKEVIQEVIVDKFVDRVVEVIKEVPVDKIVQRRVEIIKEVPMIRYVDRIVTKEVPVTQVVERTVEVLKEVPVETVKEVPVYVKVDVSDYDARAADSDLKASMYSSGTRVAYKTSAPVQAMSPGATNTGVGMVLERMRDGQIFVRKLLTGGPADKSGMIKPGDILLAVDGNIVTNWELEHVFTAIQGPEGTPVELTMARQIADRTEQFKVQLYRFPVSASNLHTVSTVDLSETRSSQEIRGSQTVASQAYI